MKIENVLVLVLNWMPDAAGDVFAPLGVDVPDTILVYKSAEAELHNLVCQANIWRDLLTGQLGPGVYADFEFASETAAQPYLGCWPGIAGRIVERQGPTISRCVLQHLILEPTPRADCPAIRPLVTYLTTTARPSCPNCNRELSSYMDAYYGREPAAAAYCADCRRKMGMR